MNHKISLAGILLLFAVNWISALDPSLPPGKNFNLGAFKLQTLDDEKKVIQISSAQLSSGFTNKYFFTDEKKGAMVFLVPSDGETTKGTHYPRSELRQSSGDSDWKLNDTKTHYMRVVCRISEVAEPKPQIIFAQIHGSGNVSEMLKMRWTGSKDISCFVEARFKTNDESKKEFGVKVAENLSLGKLLDCIITMKEGKITVTVNKNTASQIYTSEFYGTGDKYYFKAGNYLQYENSEKPLNGIVKIYYISLVPNE